MKIDLTVAGYIFYENKVLLIQHKKSKLWLPVGGHISKNEIPDSAMIRKAIEEVGLEIKILNMVGVSQKGNIVQQLAVPFYANIHNVGNHNHYCLFYICESNSRKTILEEKEIMNSKWFSVEKLFERRIPIDVRSIGLLAFKKYGEIKIK